jgi:signal transduction histidine kinase/ligand-binding sensor domain-containing protein/DNA-binding response OmpR family regulator
VGVNRLFKTRDGTLWVCTVDKGLLKWDPHRGGFLRYARDANDPNTLPHDSVQTMFEDAERVIWVGTQSGISRFVSKPRSIFNYKHQAGNPNSLRDDMIWSVHRDSKGFVWIGTEYGVDRLDRKNGQITHYRHDSKNPNSLSYDKVAAIREDRSGTLWFGTYGGGLNRFDPTTGRFQAYRHDGSNPGSLSSDAVRSLLLDRQGVLWVGTQGGGLNRFDAKTGNFKTYKDAPYFTQVIFEDRAGILWLGGENGGLFRFDPGTEKFIVYPHDPKDPQSLSSDRVYAIYEDRSGTLWVGTQNGLNRMDRSQGTFTDYTSRDGLPGNAISAILEDARGYLWLATHDGLSRFDPRKNTFRNYSEADGLPDNFLAPYFAEGSFQTEDGEIILGTSKGLTTFYPGRLSDNPHVPPVVLTNFLLFNKPVNPGSDDSPLHKPIWAADSLHLTHKQSIFTFEFAALSYIAPENNRYRYRLEPLENEWNEVDSRHRQATYTSLPAREYTFRVQGSNNDGIWNEQGVHLNITVLPPWWATWWFRSIAFLSVACLAFAAYRWRVASLHLAASRLELQVAERTRELRIAKEAADVARDAADSANRAKSRFLANMSHELRTPLNAILGFSSLLRDDDVSENQRRDLDIINRSGEYLLALINHVLDLAKIEAGRTELQVETCDLKRLIAEVTDMMRVRANEKNLPLIVIEPQDIPEFVRVDAAKLRQVLINLLGNAIKFTERGAVTLRSESRLAGAGGRLLITFEVEDTGMGIAPEDQSRIFDAFVQAGKEQSRKGTGLGLTISRQFVELMGGSIHLASEPGKGSLFRVELPVDALEKSQMKRREVQEQIVGVDQGRSASRILIVEDREENWLVLERLMRKAGFEVQIAENGARGVELFRTWRPHFIWMDMRMPVMDGKEATRQIRAMDGGQDVKIVAVTASVFASERHEVLAAGIDDFVRKPFQPAEIYNCMAQHLGLRRIYDKRPQEDQRSVLTPEDFRELSPDLVRELADVIATLDQRRILEVITRIRDRDATLANKLTHFADRFAYTAILDAVRDQSNKAS